MTNAFDDLMRPVMLTGDLRRLPPALAPLIKRPHWVLWRWARAAKTGSGQGAVPAKRQKGEEQ
jgi:hypothetical protein